MALFRSDKEFQKLWFGQSVSEIGSWVSITALPLTAVMLVGATPAQMGVLSALGSGSTLVVSLFAGVIVDRISRRPILIWSDVARALLLSTIPIAAALHFLTYTQILIVAACTGVVTVFFDVGYQSYLPSLLSDSDLAAGNRLLGMSSAAAGTVGPLMAGVLIHVATAPIAILLDAASFLVSAVSVAFIRRIENARTPVPHSDWREEALAGARAIQANPLLFALALRAVMAHFFGGMMGALYIFYAIQTLHISTISLGFLIALGGAGSFAGSYVAERISTRLGTRRAFFFAALVAGVANLLIPLSSVFSAAALVCLALAQLLGDAAWSVYITNELTFRQRVTSGELLGRVNAAMQLASHGMFPLGALAGGLIASAFGIPLTLWISAIGVAGSCLWLLMPENMGREVAALKERD